MPGMTDKLAIEILEGRTMQSVAEELGKSFNTVRMTFQRRMKRANPFAYQKGILTEIAGCYIRPSIHWLRQNKHLFIQAMKTHPEQEWPEAHPNFYITHEEQKVNRGR